MKGIWYLSPLGERVAALVRAEDWWWPFRPCAYWGYRLYFWRSRRARG